MRSEFEFIDHIKESFGLRDVGDDCAMLPKDAETDQVITVDMLVEDVDFRLRWTDPQSLGHKSLGVSLSDIAAMGADPKWAMLSIGIPEAIWNSDFLDNFYNGWHQLADRYGVRLVGGDVSRVPDKLIIDSIVAGEVATGRAITRSGAKPGDIVFVSGSLGMAAAGLKLLEQGPMKSGIVDPGREELIARQIRSEPRIELGQYLSKNGLATAMIDISDGLAADLGHICRSSAVGARLDHIPVADELFRHFESSESTDLALYGGEDFELLFTVPPEKTNLLEGRSVIRIGTITSEPGLIRLLVSDGYELLQVRGFQHFR